MAQHDTLSATQRNLLSRATSATSEPTPGYVYKDITDMVVMDPGILPTVENYLLQKLERNEPYTKFKCLKLLKNLCTRLPHDFNRNKVCQCKAVIEARNYKAPYSEYNGDYLCQMVRNEVEELLKVVYVSQNATMGTGGSATADQNRIVGFGNMPNAQSVSSTGFGNFASSNQGNYSSPNVSNTGFGNYASSNQGNYSSPNVSNTGFGNYASSRQGQYSNQNVSSTGFGNYASSNQTQYSTSSVFNTGFGNMPNSSNANYAAEGFGNSGYENQTASRSSWFGRTSFGGPSYGSAAGGSKMEGFGNILSRSSSTKSSGSSAFKLITDVAAKYLPNSVMDKLERVGSTLASTAAEKFEKHIAPATGMGMSMKAQQGGYSGAFAPVDRPFGVPSNTVGRDLQTEHALLPSLIQDSSTLRKDTEDISGESEAKLVKDVLTFSGIKVTPSQQILDDFLTRVKDMNMRYVAYELLTCLNNRTNNWQTKLRILCVFEAILLRSNIDEDVNRYITSELEPILVKCREESRLRTKSDRLIQLIGDSSRTTQGRGDLINTGRPTDQTSGLGVQGASQTAAANLDLFATSTVAGDGSKQEEPLRNVASDFTNHAFDLMDSFAPVNSGRTPQGSQANSSNKQKVVEDIFDFDKLNINPSNNNTSAGEQDLFAALDSVPFQPQARGGSQLI
ncbi:uncharacterized protein BXIN_0593 [Babesia sp. Xinjiang]|uniref:uncharacterized protein n=1 Tax=Babesia sp. Xinjiang TaxID=462227 RepID=UPI000A246C56|nr:uncharacterized protein BXIN_0593 [Babesia sp. Xinjiang]ORM41808.1 hypothetical protein BXIN_0593 [Babesia sp. Xinjiang]